jgi:hypothetical protein
MLLNKAAWIQPTSQRSAMDCIALIDVLIQPA